MLSGRGECGSRRKEQAKGGSSLHGARFNFFSNDRGTGEKQTRRAERRCTYGKIDESVQLVQRNEDSAKP